MREEVGFDVCCGRVFREDAPFEPFPDASSGHLDLDPVPASVSLARSFVRLSLVDLDVDGQDVALLLTSELVTNAILHARTPVQVGVFIDRVKAMVCVGDCLGETSTLTPQPPSDDRPGGRGLALVADLAQSWGTTRYVGGKTVWFVLQRSLSSPLSAG